MALSLEVVAFIKPEIGTPANVLSSRDSQRPDREVTSMSVVTVITFDNLSANSHHGGAGLSHCTGHSS
jgi:hypothetical protein